MATSQAEQAAELLKDLLIACALEPGAFYTEATISSQIGLGKTPVREALTRLVEQGWVLPAKGRGYEILPVTFGGIRQLFRARLIVEPPATELAAGRLDTNTADHLIGLCQPRQGDSSVNDCLELLRTNREIHATIVASSGNAFLERIVVHLLEHTDRLMFMGMAADNWKTTGPAQRVELVTALVDGDGSRARELATEHICEAESAVMNALLKAPAIEDVEVPLLVPSEALAGRQV